jgi:membrane complex biogenesis BtpA family protein
MLGIFSCPRPVIGMVHLLPLPGSPRWGGDLRAVRERALADARALAEGGVDGLLVENFGDAPFLKGPVGPETVAAMALLVQAVADAVPLPVGVNVLRNDARAALAIACLTGARFVRVNVHTGVMLTDQGLIEGAAAESLRYRRWLGAERVKLLADVLVKHGAPLAPQTPEAAARDAAQRGLADALIVSGAATGLPPERETLLRVREAVAVPVLVGSGLTPDNVQELLTVADGAIVGTSLKREGRVEEAVDARRVARLMERVRSLRPLGTA